MKKQSYLLLIKTELGLESCGKFATLGAAKKARQCYDGKETYIRPIPYSGGAY
jgi:hypothetical protein